MDVLTAIQGRKSVRQYHSQPIEDARLNKVLEAARLSPSGSNQQAWKFIVVKDQETKMQLAEAADGQLFIAHAPVIIVACGTRPERIMLCGQPSYTVDLSIAMAYLILEAYEQGLGTCWLGRFNEKSVKEILSIPENVRVVAMSPLGYPAVIPDGQTRKPLEEIICYEKYV